ncbi:MAG: sigma-70 family RNA polymerase sigma factor [Terriglobus sp.]
MTSACPTTTERQQRLLQLVIDHRNYFLRMAFRILHNEHDAEDTLQNAFYSAWKALDGFREDAQWKTWFTSIVINKALAMLRSQKVRAASSIDEDPLLLAEFELQRADHMDTPERALLKSEDHHMLQMHMERLPAGTRAVLRMRYFDDLSIDTIASHRGATVRSVEGHLMRGKKLLRRDAHKVPRALLRPATRRFAVSAA